ncbi:MAG: hypothetical protein A2X32_10725 [Elusimicrobia bacterium GWC2_64_44]|nr:MAG: hypothetical protein A2X32_10725 [Elusimicrobia bacterium GWC2_64_44]
MKKCPACAYGNPGSAVKCCVCGRDLAAVPERPEPRPEKSSPQLGLAAAALLVCAGLFWLLQTYAWKPGEPAPADDDENFSYEGVAYSLTRMADLRFLPAGDKRRALGHLASPDERAAAAAARAAGAWLRSEKDAGLARELFEALLAAAVGAGRPVVRSQAALEAGMAIALGFPAGPYAEKVRLAAGGLAKDSAPGQRAAGYFLSSMAGLEDYVPQMRQTLLYDPSSEAKLHAACALSRLGYPEGHERLVSDAGGPDAALRIEAFSCLSYSASPDAGRLLLAAAAGDLDPEAAQSAKSALIFRKQLAIIKK